MRYGYGVVAEVLSDAVLLWCGCRGMEGCGIVMVWLQRYRGMRYCYGVVAEVWRDVVLL